MAPVAGRRVGLADDDDSVMMVMATVMMMVGFRESGSRQECNHGKQQDLFHIFNDKLRKT